MIARKRSLTVRRTKEDSQQTRQRILTAARRRFASHGVTRTSLQDIATAAGVTRGAVYWHFVSKRALFRAMREQVSLPLFDHARASGRQRRRSRCWRSQHFLLGVARPDRTRPADAADVRHPVAQAASTSASSAPEMSRQCRCSELQATLASAYRRALDVGVMRADARPDEAALGTCVFITGLVRLWLMDGGASVLRPHAGRPDRRAHRDVAARAERDSRA